MIHSRFTTTKMVKLRIALNGTDQNPYHKYGLTQNPFPQIAQAEYVNPVLIIQSLGGDPIPDTDYIRKKLKGFSKEFVELCCSRFVKGAMVEFEVTF